MNTTFRATSQATAITGESMQMLARWLTRDDTAAPCAAERKQLADRYPRGLLSDAELDALLVAFKAR